VHPLRVEPLTVEQIVSLVEAVPDRYRALIVFGAGTGVRISEALGLTNDRIKWLQRKVEIDRQLVDSTRGVIQSLVPSRIARTDHELFPCRRSSSTS
jgi:integrase